MKKLFLIAFCSIAGFAFSAAYTTENIPNPKTANAHAYVSNPDGILQQETVARINVLLDSLEVQTGAEVTVVAVNSIGYADIKSFATDLFTKWGIGKAKQDNGLLILFVLDQRKVTFETGYGLEGVLPDAICKRVQMQKMIPEFKKGDYDAGLFAGTQQVASIIRKEPIAEEAATPIAWNVILPVAGVVYLLLMLLSWLWISSSVQKIRKNPKLTTNVARYKAIKAEKTGITSLIAIVIPVIGFLAVLFFAQAVYLILLVPVPFTTIPASIYAKIMMRKVRREPIPCTECGGKMHLLSEKKEDAYLKLSQQFEEQLHAVDYDVFVCADCANEAIFTLDKPTAYSDCPKCGTKAFILKEKRMLVSPTYISSGTERTTYHCKFCGYEEHKNNNIPRLTRNTGAVVGGAAAGGFFSGRGGFGGGGGGSFGGGMSGGGGATSGW